MKKCPHCNYPRFKTEIDARIDVDHCVECNIFYIEFQRSRPRLYQALEEQVNRWSKRQRMNNRVV